MILILQPKNKMNGEEKKTSTTTIFLIVSFAIVIVLIIFALISSIPSTQSTKSSLSLKFIGNTSLKSNNYFNLDFTIVNTYDVPLENVKVWVEAGKLFSISSNPLTNVTTLKSFSIINPKANVTYFFGNVKIEKVDSEMKNIPILLKVLYNPRISKNFTINVVNNNSLQLYGGTQNMGIKEKRIGKSPLDISFSFDSKNFVFEEVKRNVASFKLIIENLGEGTCISEIDIKLLSNNNLICSYNNNKLIAPFQISVKSAKKLEIPCNYTLSYLKEKDFDSVASNIQLSCNYLESRTFYFNIVP
jgi:hypothetical protein